MGKATLFNIIILLLSLVTMAGCGNNGHQNSSIDNSDSSSEPAHLIAGRDSNPIDTQPDTTFKMSPAEDSAFMHTWRLFVHAVKQHNINQLKKLIVFPLMGAGACYLPHDRLQDPQNDTTGITASQFDSLYERIFGRQTVDAITAPLSGNDPLLVRRDTSAVDRLIAQHHDRGTQTYVYHIEYRKGNREGGKYFLFARFKGQYKLAALLCDGMLL